MVDEKELLWMNEKSYLPRLIDRKITKYLQAFGAVCIEGPKWCGKTMTSMHHSKSNFFVGSPTGNFSNRKLAMMDPSLILEGDSPRLIDEWQDVPSIWDAVRHEVILREGKGKDTSSLPGLPLPTAREFSIAVQGG